MRVHVHVVNPVAQMTADEPLVSDSSVPVQWPPNTVVASR
jgi:hypothetical protein